MLPTLIQDQVYLFVGVWGRRRSFARRFCLAFGRKHKRSKERNTGGANSAATNTGTFTIFIDGQKQTLESVLNGYYTIDCTNNFFRTVLLKQSSFIKSNIPINDFQFFLKNHLEVVKEKEDVLLLMWSEAFKTNHQSQYLIHGS
jgi:hypothetical protein